MLLSNSTVEELQKNLEEKDESVPRKIISMSANLPNTDTYWRERKKELDALCFLMLKEFQVLPTYFDTSSCAEHHWKPLHKLLIEYYATVTQTDIDEVTNKFYSDSHFKHKLIHNNLHIVTKYFSVRHANFSNTVLKELFQFSDFWGRIEFAKSRGQIHSHDIFFSPKHNMVKSIMSNHEDGISKEIQLYEWLQTDFKNTDDVFSPKFISLHPAGGIEETVNGEKKWLPNKSLWAKPEGSALPVDGTILHNTLADIDTTQGLKEFHINLVNKILLHRCSLFCWRRKTINIINPDGTKSKKVVKYCRFNFGEFDDETHITSGKNIHPHNPVITGGAHQRYEGPSDHPRLIQHAKCRPMSWLANCDTQPIIEQDFISLLKYVAGYACKGAATTSDLITIYSNLLNTSASNASVRSIAQILLLKTVGMVDTPGSAVDFINTRSKLYHCSRKFKRIGLSGYRTLKMRNDFSGTVTNSVEMTGVKISLRLHFLIGRRFVIVLKVQAVDKTMFLFLLDYLYIPISQLRRIMQKPN